MNTSIFANIPMSPSYLFHIISIRLLLSFQQLYPISKIPQFQAIFQINFVVLNMQIWWNCFKKKNSHSSKLRDKFPKKVL